MGVRNPISLFLVLRLNADKVGLARSLAHGHNGVRRRPGRSTARRDVVVVVVVCRYDASERALSGARAIARADALMQ